MHDIHQHLLEQPGLTKAIRMETAMRFVRLAASLKRDIVHAQGPAYDPTVPPPSLPHNIHTFLGSAVDLSDDFVTGCWKGFKGTIGVMRRKVTQAWQIHCYSTSMEKIITLVCVYNLKGH